MKIVYSDAHKDHDPQLFMVRGRLKRSNEQPERAFRLLSAVEHDGHEVVAGEDFGAGPRAAIHTPEYLRFLETAYARWRLLDDPSDEVMPNIHPFPGEPCTYPESVVGQAGYHMGDNACSIGPHTWAAAVGSAHVASSWVTWRASPFHSGSGAKQPRAVSKSPAARALRAHTPGWSTSARCRRRPRSAPSPRGCARIPLSEPCRPSLCGARSLSASSCHA